MIKLIVDSPSCVDYNYAKEHNISVVNLNVELDGITQKEGFECDWTDYFNRLKTSKNFPKTSLPSPEDFLKLYNETFNLDSSAQIIVVTISASLSGTVNSARIAKDMTSHPDQIFVIDSGECAQSELILIEEIVNMIENDNKSAKEIAEVAESLKPKLCIEFVPSTVEYLKRGGRMSLLTSALASVLSIKPILSFRNGVLTCKKKCIGMGKALTELIKRKKKNFKKLYVCYIHESEFLNQLITKVNDAFGLNIAEGKKIGPIVGSHIGIGAVGIAYLES